MILFGLENQQQGEIVAWEDDLDNPQNWSRLKKTVNIGIVTILAFLT